MRVHRCTGPSKSDPYPCGVWVHLHWGWLRVWPLFIIHRKQLRVQFNICLGWWVSRNSRSEEALLNLNEF